MHARYPLRLALLALPALSAACASAPPASKPPTLACSSGQTRMVTGSLVPVPVDTHCAPLRPDPTLQSYGSQQLQRTGQTDTADALSQLDPSVQVVHYR